MPAIQPDSAVTPLELKTAASSLTWPGFQAAVGPVGSARIETNGDQKPVPVASTAKIITALTILQKKPLKPGESGPTITLGPRDVEIYRNYVSLDGSVVPIADGEEISQLQALQALMIPSANNIADSLAVWAFGSLEAYSVAANQFVKSHGMRDTRIGVDASGLSPTTTSTARDLVIAGKLAMQNPVLASVVATESTTNIPLAGTVLNTNTLLGTNNIVGIKTGSTDEAGGVFVGAARTTVEGQSVTLVSAVVGAPDRFTALGTTTPLTASATTNFKPVTVITAGTAVGRYSLPWGGSVSATATKNETHTVWGGDAVKATVKLESIRVGDKAGQPVGHIEATKTTFKDTTKETVILKQAPRPPSLKWRLTHPF